MRRISAIVVCALWPLSAWGQALVLSEASVNITVPRTVGVQGPWVADFATNSSGSTAVNISSIACSGSATCNRASLPASFVDWEEYDNCGASVPASSSCLISISFTPSATGARSGTITITSNGAGSPQTITLSGTGQSAPTTYDAYGGLSSLACPGWTNAYWGLQKLGTRWYFCTPVTTASGNVPLNATSHAFFSNAIGNLVTNVGTNTCTGASNSASYINKYALCSGAQCTSGSDPGTGKNWQWHTAALMQVWGFNTMGQDNGFGPNTSCTYGPFGASKCNWPSPGYDPVPMPTIAEPRPQAFAGIGQDAAGVVQGEATKDILNGENANWNGFRGGALGDSADAKLGTYWLEYLNSSNGSFIKTNSPWTLGVVTDDTDWNDSVGPGADFYTWVPPNISAAWSVAMSSPTQTALKETAGGTLGPFLYATGTTNYSKAAALNPASCSTSAPCSWRDYLKKTYTTIGAMNTAWSWTGCGANCPAYTTFDSSCTMVGSVGDFTCASSSAAESLGTGDGTTQGFTHTLVHTPVSPNSLFIDVSGVHKAGDTAWFSYQGGANDVAGTQTGYGSIVGPASILTANSTGATISGNGTTATVTTTLAPGLATGWLVSLRNCSVTAFNGVQLVNGTGSGTFTFASATNASATGCTVSWNIVAYSGANAGKLNVSFAAAPANTAAIQVDYIYNGWMSGGTGLMDESGSGQNVWSAALLGTTGYCLLPANSFYPTYYACQVSNPNGISRKDCQGVTPCQFGIDGDAWASEFEAAYFKQIKQGMTTAGSSLPYFGTDALGGFNVVPNASVIQGAAPWVDALFTDGAKSWSPDTIAITTEWQYLTRYLGDKPVYLYQISYAANDSAYFCTKGSPPAGPKRFFQMQDARGSGFYTTLSTLTNTLSFNSDFQLVGDTFWDWQDFGNGNSQGIVSFLENPYDGSSSCVAAGSDPLGFVTGGEATEQVWQATSSFGGGTQSSPSTVGVVLGGTEYLFGSTGSGTSGSTISVFNGATTLGATVTDGSLTWVNIGARSHQNCTNSFISQVQSGNSLWLGSPIILQGVNFKGATIQ